MDFTKRELNIPKLIFLALVPMILYYLLRDIVYMVIVYASTFLIKNDAKSVISDVVSSTDAEHFSELIIQTINENSMYILAVVQLVIIPIMFAIFKSDFIQRRNEGRLYKYSFKNILPKYLFIIGFGIAVMYFGNVLISFVSFFLPQSSIDKFTEVNDTLYSGSIFIQFFTIVIGAPIMEELVVRGLVYNRVKDYLGAIWAAVVSAVLFGVMHGNIVQGLYATIVGLALAFVYERYKSLWAPIFMHATCNLASFGLTYLVQYISTDEVETQAEMTYEYATQFIYVIGVSGVIAIVFAALIYFFVKPVACDNV